jgi:putative DNA-invertase from lambdoid prophage Rac
MTATVLAGIAEFERELTAERPLWHRGCQGARQETGQQSGQRPKSDWLAPRVLESVAQGRSYRLIGREVGLSKKTTMAGIVRRSNTFRQPMTQVRSRSVPLNVNPGPFYGVTPN